MHRVGMKRSASDDLRERIGLRFSHVPLDTASVTSACPGTVVAYGHCTGSPAVRR